MRYCMAGIVAWQAENSTHETSYGITVYVTHGAALDARVAPRVSQVFGHRSVCGHAGAFPTARCAGNAGLRSIHYVLLSVREQPDREVCRASAEWAELSAH